MVGCVIGVYTCLSKRKLYVSVSIEVVSCYGLSHISNLSWRRRPDRLPPLWRCHLLKERIKDRKQERI